MVPATARHLPRVSQQRLAWRFLQVTCARTLIGCSALLSSARPCGLAISCVRSAEKSRDSLVSAAAQRTLSRLGERRSQAWSDGYVMASSNSLGVAPPSAGTAPAHQGGAVPAQTIAQQQAAAHAASPQPGPTAHAIAGPASAAPVSQSIWSTRLLDLLDLVRHEFDVIGGDAMHFRSQRDEMEHRSKCRLCGRC